MQAESGNVPPPLHSKWIELRDELSHRSYWVDLHSGALQTLLDPIPLPDGSNPHAERLQRSWIAPPPTEPECMRPYPGSRRLKARTRGLQASSPKEASAWLDLDYTTPDPMKYVVSHFRERICELGFTLVDDGWFRHPGASHRLSATTPDRLGQWDVTTHSFGPTTLIHTRYTVFVPGEFRYEPPSLLELQIDHYDDECEILYLQHVADGQYFALSRYLMELCSQNETQAIPEGALAAATLLPEWLPAFPGQHGSLVRGLMPMSRARFVDLNVKTTETMEAVVDFYRQIARQLDLRVLGESTGEGRRSLLAFDPRSRFRFEVVAAAKAEQTNVNLNYWEYPAAVEESVP